MNRRVRVYDTVDLTRSPAWIGRQSYYVEHGDWFVIVSAALTVVMVLLLRSTRFHFDAGALARPASPPHLRSH